jgi:hypothetical protein
VFLPWSQGKTRKSKKPVQILHLEVHRVWPFGIRDREKYSNCRRISGRVITVREIISGIA